MRTMYLAALLAASLPAPAAAHDSNLARWDVRTRGDELVLELRTSEHALYQSLREASPDAGRASHDAATYRTLLRRLLSSVVRPEEDGAVLRARAVELRLGHESVVTMTFARQRAGPPSRLRVDLRRFSSRPNQHHLIYLHAMGRRQRVMLRPIDEHVLRWSSASGLTRTGAAR